MIAKAYLALAGMCLLAACGTPPRDVKLAGLDLGQPAVLEKLKEGLSPGEGTALITYAAFHWPGSKNYCGRPAFAQDIEPKTIGEAIDRTIAFETALTRKRMAEAKHATPASERAQQDKQLIDRFDDLTLRRDMILSRQGGRTDRAKELRKIEQQIESVRLERAKLARLPS
ncbi:hypothetical protein [Novosphingobium sp. Gsoil 351]|uniref:hypothetical protein n=1 Tax=Novosphingobium sp. Gsoil 351 TaxID=2675225 RepID=UPI0012B4E0FA|nr:hypothetical protein [Novosphingobium sp. Gsoil 351]QGN56110.1 hypothetical protein GKE62_17725 [Novosphingobium sp. Gsoil 351]